MLGDHYGEMARLKSLASRTSPHMNSKVRNAAFFSSSVACTSPSTLHWHEDGPSPEHMGKTEPPRSSPKPNPRSEPKSQSLSVSDNLDRLASQPTKQVAQPPEAPPEFSVPGAKKEDSLQNDLRENDLEGIAYGAQLLLKMKSNHMHHQHSFDPYPMDRLMGPIGGHHDHRKRASPDSDVGSSLGPGGLIISGPRPARLFATNEHAFKKGKYATTGGDRGYMTVFEYDVRGNTMMIDVETSFVRFTSITQALGRNKVNFGRLIRSCPELEPHIQKLKGGYLSIQGTWLPFDLAKELSRRIAWDIREHLVPLFGYDFPQLCLRPDEEGFGQLAIGMSQKRARKRHNNGGPHQTSCYGPAAPLKVVDGQLIEQPMPHSYQSSDPFAAASMMINSTHMSWPSPNTSTASSSSSTSSNNSASSAYAEPPHYTQHYAAQNGNQTFSPMLPFFNFDSSTHASL